MYSKKDQLKRGSRIKKKLGIKSNISTKIPTRKLEARKAIHEFIRERDKIIRGDGTSCPCCTCGKWIEDGEAGHYKHGILKEEENIHWQCTKCNKYDSGRLDNYYVFMVDTFGKNTAERFRTMPRANPKYKWYELYEIEQEYKDKLKKMKAMQPEEFKRVYDYTDKWYLSLA